MAVALAAGIALVLLALTPWTTLWDRDETLYARAAVTAWQRGNEWLPVFRGQPFLEKPPLLFVLMSLSMRVFGVTEFAARCWSPLAVAWTALAIYVLARRAWSHDIGLWAMAIFTLNPMSWLLGQAATTDALLVAGVTTAIVAGAIVLAEGATWTWMAGIVLACTVATLAKGPLAIVLVIAVLAPVALTVQGRVLRWRFVGVVAMALAGGLAYAAWFVWADARTAGALRARMFVDTWGRAVAPMHGHGGWRWLGAPYYLLTIGAGFVPWVAWLGEGARQLARYERRPTRLFLASWVIVPVVLFSLVATRLPHYVFPVWPALAIVAALGARSRRPATETVDGVDWLRLAQPVLGVGVAIGLAGAGWVLVTGSARVGLVVASLVAAAGTAWTWLGLRRDGPRAAARRALAPTGAVLVVLAAWVAPAVEPLKVSSSVAHAVVERVGPDLPVSASGFVEPGLDFYLQRDLEVLGADQLRAWAARPGRGVLLLADGVQAPTDWPPAVRDAGHVRAFDHTKGRFVDVRILERDVR